MAKLGDICFITMGQSPDSATYNESGNGLPFFQGNADFGKINPTTRIWCSEPKKIANPDDILISVRAPIGALNIADIKCCIGRGLASLTVNDDKSIKKYIWYALKSKTNEMISVGTGSTFKAIGKDVLYNLEIPLPPVEIQHQIAQTLDKVTHLIDLCNQILDKLDLLVKSRFVKMFGGIHDSSKYHYKAVSSFAQVISGGTPNRDVAEYWENGTIPWVKTTELKNDIIINTEEYITDKGLQDSSAKIVPPNTILIAMYGQGKTRGMTAYLSIEASTNQACACILPTKNMNQLYLWQYFILSYDKLRSMAKGGNQPNLNGNIIKNFPVLLPPVELQNQFAAFVEQTDKSKLAVKQVLEKAETLKKALMQKYFE